MDRLSKFGDAETLRPDEISYTAVINSCASPSVADPRIRRKALDTALFTLKELQASRYSQPNQVTYGLFIKACATLLNEDDVLRRELITRAFEQCCLDGQLGQIVLHYTPSELYEDLLAGYVNSGICKVSVNDLPTEWCCNVKKYGRMKRRVSRCISPDKDATKTSKLTT